MAHAPGWGLPHEEATSVGAVPVRPALRDPGSITFNGVTFTPRAHAAAEFEAFRSALASNESAAILLGFSAIPDSARKRWIAAQGIELLSYVPDGGWIARVHGRSPPPAPAMAGVTIFTALDATLRVSPLLSLPSETAAVPVYVHLLRGADASSLQGELRAAGFADLGVVRAGGLAYMAGRVAADRLDRFLAVAAEHRDVQFIERGRGARLMNDLSLRILQSGSYAGDAVIWQQGIWGSNQVIAVCDSGLDIDSCYFRDPSGALPPTNRLDGTNVNFSLRKVIAADFLYAGDNPASPTAWDNVGHGTKVAGHAAASNLYDPLGTNCYNGMAPLAKLIVQDGGYVSDDQCGDIIGLGCPITNYYRALAQAAAQGATIHNNSWGDNENAFWGPINGYTEASREADLITWLHKEFLVVCAAGNSGRSGNNTVASPSTAKNALSVGATQGGSGQESVADFSSRGWASDGRIKPDVMAPGAGVIAAQNDSNITTLNCDTRTGQGTSYSSPMTAGMAALVRDYFAQGFYPNRARTPSNAIPRLSAAFVKAVLVNASVPMRNAAAKPPSRDQGWGRINLSRALAFTNAPTALFAADAGPAFDAESTPPYTAYLEILATNAPLKVTLVWSDYPATPGATGKQLVNDLDLMVRNPFVVLRGNALSNGCSVAGGVWDRTNNVEQVVWTRPATGIVELSVWPHIIPQPTQDFALVASGCLQPWPANRDDDHDALPDAWELRYLGNLSSGATNDVDRDGVSNYAEWLAGTDPGNAADALAVSAIRTDAETSEVIVQWNSVAGRFYLLRTNASLQGPSWGTFLTRIPATDPLNTVTVKPDGHASSFYRVEVDGSPPSP